MAYSDEGSQELQDIAQQVHSIVSRFNELVRERDEEEHKTVVRDQGVKLLEQDLRMEIEIIKQSLLELYAKLDEAHKLKQNIIGELRDVAKIDSFTRINRRVDGKNYENSIGREEFRRVLQRSVR